MLIFIENTPRAYAWGSRDALPELLGTSPTGEPQAELWLGAHPGDPATVAKAVPGARTLIDLIESDPERYGVDGGQLPFLLKVLAIGAPLSLQAHPDKAQAEAGFAAEEAAGIARDARERNYGDPNHKPELLVALSEVSALSGFRDIGDAKRELLALAELAGGGPGAEALERAAGLCGVDGASGPEPGDDGGAHRRAYLAWALGGGSDAIAATRAIGIAVRGAAASEDGRIDRHRLAVLRQLTVAYPDDPGVLVSLLLHLVRLEPGEAIYLGARQLHAYLSGIAVEVMASSDNVLRAGFTEKHVDVDELLRIVDFGELDEPKLPARELAPGLLVWEPGVPDFRLLRARLRDPGEPEPLVPAERDGRASSVELTARYPLVLIVTSGRVRVERPAAEFDEVASVGRGQSLYVSAGDPIELSGSGEVFIATVAER